MLWPTIYCTQYRIGKCLHPAAPKEMSFFGKNYPYCIEALPFDPKDNRIGTINRCKVKIPYQKPGWPPGSL